MPSQCRTKPLVLTYGKLSLNPANNEVNYGDRVLTLTPKEYMILELFMRQRDRVFSRSEILDKLWEIERVIVAGDRTIRIPSTRLQNRNYGWNGAYFITISTKNRIHYLGKVVNGKMQLSHIGIVADILWYEIKNHAERVELGEFVVMPNHIHGILILNDNNRDRNFNNNDNQCRDKACLVSS